MKTILTGLFLLLAAAFGLAAGLAGLALGQLPFFRVIESKLYDLDLRWTVDPARADPSIVIVEIDEIKVGEGTSANDAIVRAHARGVAHGWEAALAALMEASRPLPCQADVHRLVMWVKELAVRRGSPEGERP
jgi:hypothetical protein